MHDLSARNTAQRLPDFALERCACRGGRQGVNDAEIALEVRRQFVAQAAGVGGADTFITLRAIVHVEQRVHPVAVFFPLNGAQTKLLVCNHPQWTKRRGNFIFE